MGQDADRVTRRGGRSPWGLWDSRRPRGGGLGGLLLLLLLVPPAPGRPHLLLVITGGATAESPAAGGVRIQDSIRKKSGSRSQDPDPCQVLGPGWGEGAPGSG